MYTCIIDWLCLGQWHPWKGALERGSECRVSTSNKRAHHIKMQFSRLHFECRCRPNFTLSARCQVKIWASDLCRNNPFMGPIPQLPWKCRRSSESVPTGIGKREKGHEWSSKTKSSTNKSISYQCFHFKKSCLKADQMDSRTMSLLMSTKTLLRFHRVMCCK